MLRILALGWIPALFLLGLSGTSSFADDYNVELSKIDLFDFDLLMQRSDILSEETQSAFQPKKDGSSAYPDEWEFELTPYFQFPAVDYRATVAGQSKDLDLSFGDLMDDFDVLAISGHFEGYKGNWGFIFNSAYASIQGDFEIGPFLDLDVDIVDFPTELALGYRFDPYPLQEGRDYPNLVFTAKTGLRYHYLRQRIDIDPGPKLGQSEDWVEPVVGGRVRLHTSEKLWFSLMTDFGGFGIGSASDITVNVLGAFGYEFTKNFGIRVGYLYNYIDYSKGSGIKEFALKGDMQGPLVGFTWRF